jgi:hypothetical protein
VRIVKAIPGWGVYYKRGKHIRRYWTQPILFNEEVRDKYAKKELTDKHLPTDER